MAALQADRDALSARLAKAEAERDSAREIVDAKFLELRALEDRYTAVVKERDEARSRLDEISAVVTHEHYNNFAAMVHAYREERARAERAEAEAAMWCGECESISTELGLPPTMRPVEGELRRIMQSAKDARTAALTEAAEVCDRHAVETRQRMAALPPEFALIPMRSVDAAEFLAESIRALIAAGGAQTHWRCTFCGDLEDEASAPCLDSPNNTHNFIEVGADGMAIGPAAGGGDRG